PRPHLPTGHRGTHPRRRVDQLAAASRRAGTRPARHVPDPSNRQGDNDMSDIIERSEIHATFVIERSYPVPVSAVWHALSDSDARDQWFGGGAAFDVREKSHDFRMGGHGVEDGRWRDGPTSRFVSTYTDIVDEQRM